MVFNKEHDLWKNLNIDTRRSVLLKTGAPQKYSYSINLLEPEFYT